LYFSLPTPSIIATPPFASLWSSLEPPRLAFLINDRIGLQATHSLQPALHLRYTPHHPPFKMTRPEPCMTAVNLSFERPDSAWAQRLNSKTAKTPVTVNKVRRAPTPPKSKDKVLNLKNLTQLPVINTQNRRRSSSSASAASSPLVPSPGLPHATAISHAGTASMVAAELNPNALPFVPTFSTPTPPTSARKNNGSSGKGKNKAIVALDYAIYPESEGGADANTNMKIGNSLRRTSQSSTPQSASYYQAGYDMEVANWGEGYEYGYDYEYDYEYDVYPSQHLSHY